MGLNNETSVTEFLLLSFQNIHKDLIILLFLFVLVIYICILSGNLLIIALVLASPNLKSPMYFFLANLSWADIILTTAVIPNLLSFLLENKKAISFTSCITQLQVFCSSVDAEIFQLAVMSYDRYLAICKPLHYLPIMDSKRQVLLMTSAWIFGFLLSSVFMSQIIQLRFCGPSIKNHFFCDPVAVLEFSCSDTSRVRLSYVILGLPLTLLPLGFIFSTYVYIFTTVLKISTSTGRKKAFSTCSSHLTVVCIFYITLITLYVFPSKASSGDLSKLQSLLCTIVPPLLNPIIYSLRNKEMQTAIKLMFYEKQ